MDEDMEAASHDDACESADEGRTTKAPRRNPPSEGESDQEEDDERDILAMDDCGKVKMIECTNFMCHRRLQVKLGPNINFITGQNGSGKSAIVAALQICLGLSARSTNRGQWLSCLIRHGSNAGAVVAVELINEGAEAYQPDLYGSTIRIERTLKSSGASSFRILNGDTRKCVSTRRGTVDDIVKRFNTFVDNPSCILDQETSKTFLRGSAKDKYKVFMRATNLEAHINPLKKEEENLRHDMREVYECKLKKLFEINLSYRQHTGSVNIDHEKKTLEFTWSKTLDSQQSQHEAKDAGQLSGGESSFTSLAFLMALGQVMESPWRVMDNFDVFMDHDNRKLSLELIVDSARDKVKFLGKKSCQIILITPHDVSSVSAAPIVRKIRMRPPESEFGRAQQTTLT